jgi:hypothetical protein
MLENESKLGDVLSVVPPGISWTAPSKGRPWMNQPAVVDVSSVAQAYIESLGQAEAANDILDALETQIPLATIAESFMLTGVSMGRHTLDAGILVMPVIIEVLQSIADFNDIKTVKFTQDLEKGTTIHPRVLREFAKKASETTSEPMIKEVAAEPKGLMARKSKEVIE